MEDRMKQNRIRQRFTACVALLLLISTLFLGCSTGIEQETTFVLHELRIRDNHLLTMEIGDTVQLDTDAPEEVRDQLEWSSSHGCVGITQDGLIIAQACGQATVRVAYGLIFDSIQITVVEELSEAVTGGTARPDGGTASTVIESERSPEGYRPAASREEALSRTEQGELSGYPYVPDQAPVISAYRPMEDGLYIKNNAPCYADEDTYVVVDAYGCEVFRIYRGGGYITLEEVAAYVYAFGDVPANYTTSKKTSPTASVWGEHLRVNHSKFSGDTSKYPYEPVLPRISGCGGDLTYYELDIGTTGTDCDPSYAAALYNNGYRITRGAARIVYARFDRNGNRIIDPDEKHVFYTYNHYNDFREYLNYYGGWGEMFGNVTGGGTISSKYDYNPTDYVPVVNAPLRERSVQILPTLLPIPAEPALPMEATLLHCDLHRYRELAA